MGVENMLIALSGKRKSGKTLSAVELQRIGADHDIRFEIIPFAGPLKDTFAEIHGIERSLLDSPTRKEEYREQLQEFGAKMRAQDPKYWIKKLAKTIKEHKHVITDDCRFLNELQFFCEKKAILIRIDASDKTRNGRGWFYDSFIDTHPSETELDFSVDTWRALGQYIYNNKTIDDLNWELTMVFNKYVKINV